MSTGPPPPPLLFRFSRLGKKCSQNILNKPIRGKILKTHLALNSSQRHPAVDAVTS